MLRQEYQHIRNLAWDLLIDANISSLPVSVELIASLYNLQSEIQNSKTRYENAISVSHQILNIFGYADNFNFSSMLATRILCPLIVLKNINIKSADDIIILTELPPHIAKQRYERYLMLLKRNSFETSELETKVLNQFNKWITTHKY